MENFDHFSDGLVDSEPYKSKSIENFSYHLISNIYNGRSRTACKELNSCCARQLVKSEYLIQISPINKLIEKNKKRMNKNIIQSAPKSIYCSRIQDKFTYNHQKSIKNEVVFTQNSKNHNISRSPKNQEILRTTKEECSIKCSKNKRNWSECFAERRRSRRLSNLPPINIKEESIDTEEFSVSFNKRSFRLLNELDNCSDYSLQEEDSFEVPGTSFSPDRSTTELNQTYNYVDEVYKETPHIVTPFVLTPINLKCSKSNFAQIDNCNTTEDCIVPENLLSQEKEQTYTFDGTINLSWPGNKINECNLTKNAVIRDSLLKVKAEPMDYEQTNAHHYTSTNIISPENSENYFIETNDCHATENCIVTENPLGQDITTFKKTYDGTNTCSKCKTNNCYLTENSVITEHLLSPKTEPIDSEQFCGYTNEDQNHEVVDSSNCFTPMILECWSFKTSESQVRPTTKNDLSPPKTRSEIIETKEPDALKCSEMEKAQFSHISHSDKYKMKKIQSLNEKYNNTTSMFLTETRETEGTSSNRFDSEINETEVTSPSCPSYSKIDETDGTSSPPETYSEIAEMENALYQSKIYSKMTYLNRQSLPETYSEIKTKDGLSQLNIYSKITEVENSPSSLKTYSKITQRENSPSLTKTYSEVPLKENSPSLTKTFNNVFETKEESSPQEAYSNDPKTDRFSLPETHYRKVINKLTLQKEFPDLDNLLLSNIHLEKTVEDKYPKIMPTSEPIKLKKYSEMTVQEKKLYREKLNFVTSLGLLSIERYLQIYGVKVESNENETPIEEPLHSKVLSKVTEDYTERTYFRTSSEKVRRSYLLEYSNDKNDQKKHIAVPILIPERTSGSSFHPERTCMLKCSSCHGKFGLLDTPCHLAQIKNPDKQKACLENVPHLIGPVSCLCAACFRAIEKRSSKKYLSKNACIIMTCKRSASHVFKSPWIEKIKCMLIKNGVMFRTWANQVDSMPICSLHHNQVLNVTQCQLCGNRTVQKFEVDKSETHEFQLILDDDHIPYIINDELLICKACRVYLLWRSHKETNIKDQQVDFVKHQDTIIRRICKHKQFELPSYLAKKIDSRSVESQINIEIQEISKSDKIPLSELVENKTITNDEINDCTINSLQTLQSTEVEATTKVAIGSVESSDSEIITTTVAEVVSNPSLPPMIQSTDMANVNFQPKLCSIENNYIKHQPPNFKKLLPKSLQVCKPSVLPIPPQLQISQSVETALPTVLPIPKPIRPRRFPKIPCSQMNSKTRLNRRRPKVLQVAHVTPETANLFNELMRPYGSSVELVNHLLLLEKCRRLGDLVLAKHGNNKTKQQNLMSSTIGLSKPLYRFPKYKPNKQTLLHSNGEDNENISGIEIPPNNINYNDVKINLVDNANDDFEGRMLKKQKLTINCASKNEGREIPSNQNLTFTPITTTTTTKYIKIPKSIISKNVICKPSQSYNNIITVSGDGVGETKKVNTLPISIANTTIAEITIITPTTSTTTHTDTIITTNTATTTTSITNIIGISTNTVITTSVVNSSTISTTVITSPTTATKTTVNDTNTNIAVTTSKVNQAAKASINDTTAALSVITTMPASKNINEATKNEISITVTTTIIGNHNNSSLTTTTTPTSIDSKINPITSVQSISNKVEMVKTEEYAQDRKLNVTKSVPNKIRNCDVATPSLATPSSTIKLASIKPLLSSSTSNTVGKISTICTPKTVRLVNTKQLNSEELRFTMANGTNLWKIGAKKKSVQNSESSM